MYETWQQRNSILMKATGNFAFNLKDENWSAYSLFGFINPLFDTSTQV